jgi:outer membrane biosynthesis protein TonB
VLYGRALGGFLFALACAACALGLSFATPAQALEPVTMLTDTEPPPASTEPMPDPAPPPATHPKPAPKTRPAARPPQAPVHHTSTHRRATAPADVTRRARRKAVAHRRRHRVTHVADKRKVVAETKPMSTRPALARLPAVSQAAAVTSTSSYKSQRGFVIAGLGLAAVLFLLVASVPSTAAHSTTAGRVVVYHRVNLLIAGILSLLSTAILLAMSGGS